MWQKGNAVSSDAKEPELPATYYSHKRTTLLTSGALLILSLPDGGKSTTLQFEGVSLAIGSKEVILFVLLITAVYYVAYFTTLWVTDSAAYARAKVGVHPHLEREIENQLSLVNTASHELVNATKTLNSALDQTLSAKHVSEFLDSARDTDIDALNQNYLLAEDLQRLKIDLENKLAPLSLSLTDEQMTAITDAAALELRTSRKEIYHHARNDIVGAAAGYIPRPYEQHLIETMTGMTEILPHSSTRLDSIKTSLAALRAQLHRARVFVWFRLGALDILPCWILFVLAFAHYTNRYHPWMTWTIATPAKLLGLLSPAGA